MAKVFISYAKDDGHWVDALEAALEASGVDVWRDRSQIPPGAHHWRQIEHEIENAGVFVLCCSVASLNNENVLAEVEHAKSHKVRLLTIALEPPRSLPSRIEIAGRSLEDLSAWRGDVLDPAFLKVLSAIGEATKNEELKRRYPDWVAEQRRTEEAQKRAAAAKEAAEITRRRIEAEAAAAAKKRLADEEAARKAEFDQAKAVFTAAQRRRFEALPVAADAKRSLEESRRRKANFRDAENFAASRKISGSPEEQLGWVVYAGMIALPVLVFVLLHDAGGFVYFNLGLVGPIARIMEWTLWIVNPLVILALSVTIPIRLGRWSVARRVETARDRAANADVAHQQAQAAADEAWKPFQRAIDAFEFNAEK